MLLLGIAEVNDEENPADEGICYVVYPGGTIRIYPDGEEIDWLFVKVPELDANLLFTMEGHRKPGSVPGAALLLSPASLLRQVR